MSAPGFIEVGSLGGGAGAVPLDFARTRARWAALPDEWLTKDAMIAAIKEKFSIAEWDDGGAQAALLSMGDFIQVRGPARNREYRRVPEPPDPLTASQREEARVAAAAAREHELFEKEMRAREQASRDQMAPFFEGQRRVHEELAAELTHPRIDALQARVAALEARLGEPEADVVTPAPASSTAPAARGSAEDLGDDLTEGEVKRLLAEAEGTVAEPVSEAAPVAPSSQEAALSRREQIRRFLFGDVSQGDAERLLQDGEDENE